MRSAGSPRSTKYSGSHQTSASSGTSLRSSCFEEVRPGHKFSRLSFGHDVEHGQPRVKLLSERDGVRGGCRRFGSKVGGEQDFADVGSERVGMRTDGEDRARHRPEDLFGDRTEKHLGESGASTGSDDYQIGVVFLEDLLEVRLNAAFFEQNFGIDPREGFAKLIAVPLVGRLRSFDDNRPSRMVALWGLRQVA